MLSTNPVKGKQPMPDYYKLTRPTKINDSGLSSDDYRQ